MGPEDLGLEATDQLQVKSISLEASIWCDTVYYIHSCIEYYSIFLISHEMDTLITSPGSSIS